MAFNSRLQNYKRNTSWVYCGVGGICVLLHLLYPKLDLDDKQVGLTRSWGSMNFCKVWSSPSNHSLRDCLGVWLVGTCWKLDLWLIVITFNVFQKTLSPTMKNQGFFIWWSRQNIDGVNGKWVKMCGSIMESGRRK
jgi:hypothetical protein